MSNIAIIPQVDLPPALLAQFAAINGADDLDAGVSGGFPVMSIRGAKWRIVEHGEEHPIYMPGTTDLAPSVKVVLLRANPAVAKTFYAQAFVEGSDTAPDCYSNDGVRPAADAPAPQCESCAACPQNVWGSKISPNGSKIKACADVRRVAILPADDQSYSPILLRVPAASLADLAAYGKALKQRGIPYSAVVTKLSFDPDASYPKIMFKFERVLTPDELALVASRLNEPVVDDILGVSTARAPAVAAPAAADQFGIPADVAKQATVQAEPANPTSPATRTAGGFGGAAQAGSSAGVGADTAQSETASAATAGGKTTRSRKAQPPADTAQPEAATGGGDMLSDIDAALAGLNL